MYKYLMLLQDKLVFIWNYKSCESVKIITMKNFLQFVAIALFSGIAAAGFSQVSRGGSPISFQNSDLVKTRPVVMTLRAVDVDRLRAEDVINDQNKDIPWRFGENIDVDYTLLNSGSWDLLPGGDRIWRLGIRSEGALTINLTFSDYHMPPGATLFVYNVNKTEVIGAFTDFNNQENGVFATTLVSGDQVVMEYYEPAKPDFPGVLNLTRVTHGYRNAFEYARSFGNSGSCNNNVNCPEAAGWENQVRSVCMLVSGGNGFCTGAVVNNTSWNGVPYVLTANHCYSDPSSWVFWFNWQSPTCANPGTSPSYNSLSGATLRSRNSDSDFCLVEMSSTPPSSYNVYYAGWNRENVGASSGAGIHHPSGDIKKISYSITPFTSDTWSGTPADSHWKVIWNDGVTEPGSSGSPMFDQNHRVIGQLHGGPSACSATQLWDFYGKFSMSWAQGTTAATRLQEWLDPVNTSVTTLEGFDPNAGIHAVFIANSTAVCSGGSATFTDLSTGSPTSWAWSFPGGTPASYNGQNPPPVSYASAGTYDVSLTVSDGTNTDTQTKPGYILVKTVAADFTGTPATVVIGNSVTFTDNSSCGPATWVWSFPGGTPSSWNGQTPPAIVYNTLGTYDVILTVTKPGGSDTKTRTGYITVTPPVFNIANGTVTTCTGDFYDSGGLSGSYQNNETYVETFYPSTTGSMLRFAFTSFSTEPGYDTLTIYNGINSSAPVIGKYHGTAGPGIIIASNAAGALTFRFHSDVSVVNSGWAASISCYSTAMPPVADFLASATAPLVGQAVTFTDLSANFPASWSWSFSLATIAYTGGTSATSQNPQVQFLAAGLYSVTMTATNGFGSGTKIKTNYINVPNCTISAFPWTEGFENGGAIPNCWSQEQVNSSGVDWVFVAGNGSSNPATSHGGTLNACLKDASSADNKTRLITPPLNLLYVSSPQLKFWHTQAFWSPDQDQLTVFYKTSANGTWTQLSTYTASITAWTQETVLLPAATNGYYIAFEGNAKYGYGVCVDDVEVSTSCASTVPVSIVITASANPVDAGTPVTFTATGVNAGVSPVYQWMVNGSNAGTNTNTYTYVPVDGDQVTCMLTSNAGCVSGNPAMSNMVTMTVNSVPITRYISNITVSGAGCFDAIQTILVAGNETTFTVLTGGSATMIAGQNILFYPGASVAPGGYLHGYIAPGGPYCTSPAIATSAMGTTDKTMLAGQPFFSIYPNPTCGAFTLVLSGYDPAEKISVEIYNMKGEKIISTGISNEMKHEFSLSGRPAGIYLIRILSKNTPGTARIIKQQ